MSIKYMRNIYTEDDSIFSIPSFDFYYHEETKQYQSSAIFSRDRTIILQESIDADEGFGNILRPVFIILLYSDNTFDHVAEKIVKNQHYWHAAIRFGPSLKHTYSFNFKVANANKIKGGLSFESLSFYQKEHPTGTMEVSCILLGKDKYNKLKETLNYYLSNKEKTKYDFFNLLRSLFGKSTPDDGHRLNLVCSTFVDTILKSIDINISNAKNINLTKPDDLRAMRRNEKQFKVYSGKIVNYNIQKVIDKADKLASEANNNYFAEINKK